MTRASPSRQRPLKVYGIESYMPMISSIIVLGPSAATLLHSYLLQLHGRRIVRGIPAMLTSDRFKPPRLIPQTWLAENYLHKLACTKLDFLRADSADLGGAPGGTKGDSSASGSNHLIVQGETCRPDTFQLECHLCHAWSQSLAFR